LNAAKGQYNYTVDIIQLNPDPGQAPAYVKTCVCSHPFATFFAFNALADTP